MNQKTQKELKRIEKQMPIEKSNVSIEKNWIGKSIKKKMYKWMKNSNHILNKTLEYNNKLKMIHKMIFIQSLVSKQQDHKISFNVSRLIPNKLKLIRKNSMLMN